MQHSTAVLVLPVLLALNACTAPPPPATGAADGVVPCPSPRPQICTMIYDPVCATREDGSRTTEASNCSACGKPEVVSYTQGACPETLPALKH